jgi:hypothetical protein
LPSKDGKPFCLGNAWVTLGKIPGLVRAPVAAHKKTGAKPVFFLLPVLAT